MHAYDGYASFWADMPEIYDNEKCVYVHVYIYGRKRDHDDLDSNNAYMYMHTYVYTCIHTCMVVIFRSCAN